MGSGLSLPGVAPAGRRAHVSRLPPLPCPYPQMNYLNKALDLFNTAIVTPMCGSRLPLPCCPPVVPPLLSKMVAMFGAIERG